MDQLTRLKNKRFGRLIVTVSDGRIVGVELQEKVDRRLLSGLSDAADRRPFSGWTA